MSQVVVIVATLRRSEHRRRVAGRELLPRSSGSPRRRLFAGAVAHSLPHRFGRVGIERRRGLDGLLRAERDGQSLVELLPRRAFAGGLRSRRLGHLRHHIPRRVRPSDRPRDSSTRRGPPTEAGRPDQSMTNGLARKSFICTIEFRFCSFGATEFAAGLRDRGAVVRREGHVAIGAGNTVTPERARGDLPLERGGARRARQRERDLQRRRRAVLPRHLRVPRQRVRVG